MTKLSLCCAIVLVGASVGLASAQQLQATDPTVAQATDIVVRVFKALKKGDIQTIRHYMSPELYEQYRVLFEQNTEYPAFLRKYYQGTELRIKKVAKVRGHTQVQTAIDFPTGASCESKILLMKKNADLKIHVFLEEWNQEMK
jgi:hypothetical protein